MRARIRVVEVCAILLITVTTGALTGALGLGVGHASQGGNSTTGSLPAVASGSIEFPIPPSSRLTSSDPLALPHVVSRVYSKASTVNAETSIGSTALLDLRLPDNANELVLFDAAHNTSTVVQSIVPGGNLTSLAGIASAGGKFFLSWNNISSGKEFWQEVTTSGKVSVVTLPIGDTLSWGFPYGNGTALYAFSSGFLVQINPTTLNLKANYSSYLPAHVGLNSVLPVGTRLYLAGSLMLTNGATNAYFGFLNLKTGKVTTVSKTIKTYPVGLDAFFATLLQQGSYIFVGGALETANSTTGAAATVNSYFFRYTSATATLTNLSSLLPVKTWGVWALEPWATTIALSLGGYNTSVPGEALAGGIFALVSTGMKLVNETSLFPSGYIPGFWEATSFTGGWFFSGGYKGLGGPAEAVAGQGLPLTIATPNAHSDGDFGFSVTVSGTTVVVGAPGETGSGKSGAGHAYVFNTKTDVATALTSPNAQSGGEFGSSVAVSGPAVVVGAPSETASCCGEAGHVYIFSATTGELISTLSSPNPEWGGFFGFSVAISGTTVVVGAPGETASGDEGAGHVYTFSATTGELISTLTSPNVQSYGAFGNSVAISGATIVVGAETENASGDIEAGHAYTFNTTTDELISTLTSPNAQPYGLFGGSVAVSGTTVVVGAGTENASGLPEAGHAYTFSATTGDLISTLTSPNAQSYGLFGVSVAISGTTVAVGAYYETASGQPQAGHAYTLSATTGDLISTLTSPNAQLSGGFGFSVAISGTTVVVGAPNETASGKGSAGHAYIFST